LPLFALATIISMASRSGAESPVSAPIATTVVVDAPPCIGRPYDRGHLVELLRIELATLGVNEVVVPRAGTPAEVDPARLLATIVLAPSECRDDATEVTITLVDRASSKSVERRMTLADVGVDERPRAMAIAVSELLSASLAELELAGSPPPAVAPPPEVHAALVYRLVPAMDAARRETDRRILEDREEQSRRVRAGETERAVRERAPELDVSAFTWAMPSRQTALLGGAARLRLRGSHALAFRLGADFAMGDVALESASALVGAATASAGIGVATRGPTELDVFTTLHAGYGFAHGTPSGGAGDVQGHSYGNGIAALLFEASLRLPIDARWSALFGVDLGYVLADVSFLSDSSRIAGIGGAVLGASAGASLGL
jgi:hypothetical protein